MSNGYPGTVEDFIPAERGDCGLLQNLQKISPDEEDIARIAVRELTDAGVQTSKTFVREYAELIKWESDVIISLQEAINRAQAQVIEAASSKSEADFWDNIFAAVRHEDRSHRAAA